SASSSRGIARTAIIALTAFLTLVDLFATQALLPALAQRYAVSPAAMGGGVNACTPGMAVTACTRGRAVSSLAVALISRRIERRSGIWVSLALLAIPTVLLAVAPDLITFAILRVLHGI